MTDIEMTLNIQRIGAIDLGVDGSDEYLLVWDNDQDHKIETIERHLLERYYRHTDTPGGYYCYAVDVGPCPRYEGRYIAIVHHRYDV